MARTNVATDLATGSADEPNATSRPERDHARIGRRSQRKGAAAERELAKRFAEVMPGCAVRRGLQWRDGGQAVPDVDAGPLWIESKHGKKPNVRAALEQATNDAPKGRVPIAVIRDDRRDPFVTMSLEDFLDFVGEWWTGRMR